MSLEDYAKECNHMFYVDYPWKQKGDYLDIIERYFVASVVGYEKTEKGIHHLQVFAIGTPAKYNAFIAKWKIDYEKLTGCKPNGKTMKGQRKMYGRVKDIKKEPKYAIAYCMKDGEYVVQNIDPKVVEECKGLSYKKPTSRTYRLEQVLKVAKNFKHLWYEDRREYIGMIVEAHHKAYQSALQLRTLQRYLLDAQVMSYADYADAMFGGFLSNFK